MKKFQRVLKLLTAFCVMLPLVATASPEIGKAAPDFSGTDSNGKTVKLADLKGKVVVLEWSNNGCPYVRKWYKSGAMQQLQKDAAKSGAVWLTIISSGQGKEGYVTGAEANHDTQSRNASPTYVLLDPKGTIGHLYDARTTPDMFVIAADGKLAYMGGADSIASTDESDIAKAEPYALEAIEAVAAGKPVAHPVTKPYGCNVKYSD